MTKLSISYQSVMALKLPNPNARKHSNQHIRRVMASIQRYGWTNPILITREKVIVAGQARYRAAIRLGSTSVPTIYVDGLSPEDVRAYIIADNKLAEGGGYDVPVLALELKSLIELDYDIEATGFEFGEIDQIIYAADTPAGDAADAIPPLAARAVTQLGDKWILGNHRLLCGNALEPESYELLLEGQKAQLAFTDPPYGVPVDGHVCGNGQVKHREFPMASGEMSKEEFRQFLRKVFDLLHLHSVDGSIHQIFMSWHNLFETLGAGLEIYSELKSLCVWNKSNGGMGSFYRNKHELVLVFKAGTAQHINNISLGKHGRNRTTVWDYPGVNTLEPARRAELEMHPTVKPVRLIADAILDCSKRKGIVLDPFVGSGTTILAAEQTGRHAYCMELDTQYVDLAIRRWQEITGQNAVLASSGETFAEVSDKRAEPNTIGTGELT